MPASVHIDEFNSAGATVSHGITGQNYAAVDAANQLATDYPISPGTNSFKKYHKLHVTALGGVTSVQNIRFWISGGAVGAGDAFLSSARTSSYAAPSFATPTTTTLSDPSVPTSEPVSANVGIGGSLGGSITSTSPGTSDYVVSQVQVGVGTVAGASPVCTWEWDEIA